jgi:hypothetical protein
MDLITDSNAVVVYTPIMAPQKSDTGHYRTLMSWYVWQRICRTHCNTICDGSQLVICCKFQSCFLQSLVPLNNSCPNQTPLQLRHTSSRKHQPHIMFFSYQQFTPRGCWLSLLFWHRILYVSQGCQSFPDPASTMRALHKMIAAVQSATQSQIPAQWCQYFTYHA